MCILFYSKRFVCFSPESVLQHESPVEEFLRRRHLVVKTGSKARSIHYLVLFVLAAIRLMLKTLLDGYIIVSDLKMTLNAHLISEPLASVRVRLADAVGIGKNGRHILG